MKALALLTLPAYAVLERQTNNTWPHGSATRKAGSDLSRILPIFSTSRREISFRDVSQGEATPQGADGQQAMAQQREQTWETPTNEMSSFKEKPLRSRRAGDGWQSFLRQHPDNLAHARTTIPTASGEQKEGQRCGIVKLFLFQDQAKIRAIMEKMKEKNAQASQASASEQTASSLSRATPRRGNSTGKAAKQGRPDIVAILLE